MNKMFPIAQLIKVHLQLWPWLTFRGHLGVILRSRKWKSSVASQRLLLGPGCLCSKMFTVAHLTKMHHDLWPWMRFMGHFKVRNVRKACNVWTVPPVDRLTVSERKWRLDTGCSEHPVTFDLDWPWMDNFKVTECQTSNRVYGGLNYAKDGSDHSISYLHRVLYYDYDWLPVRRNNLILVI